MKMMDFDRGELIRRALEQQQYAYAPYSGYFVSAAVLTDSGKIYTGVNVENASYPAGICAERNAIFHAVACGKRKITAIAIVGGKQGENRKIATPCGICRQVMREFCRDDFAVLAFDGERIRTSTLIELLPESFSPADLA